MKKSLHRIAFALVLCTLLNVAALAGGKSRRVTFNSDVTVGDTVVKKGSYKVTFDDETNVLTISDEKKVIAKTTARLEEFKNKSRQFVSHRTWKNETGGVVLSSINLGGRYAVIGSDNAAATIAPAATVQQ